MGDYLDNKLKDAETDRRLKSILFDIRRHAIKKEVRNNILILLNTFLFLQSYFFLKNFRLLIFLNNLWNFIKNDRM